MNPEQIDYNSLDLPEDDLPHPSDNDRGKVMSRSVAILLALFIAAPLSFYLFDNTLQIVAVWIILGLLMGIRRSPN